jgi:hypothetical protein
MARHEKSNTRSAFPTVSDSFAPTIITTFFYSPPRQRKLSTNFSELYEKHPPPASSLLPIGPNPEFFDQSPA